MRTLSLPNLLWLVAYLLVVTAIVGGLLYARRWVLAELDRPEARAQWEQWRADEIRRHEDQSGPVRRHPPVSREPPALVMLRDYFVASAVACLAIGSFLFGFFMLVLRGIFSQTERSQ